MEIIDFCDHHCPIPARWIEFPKVDDELTTDCDLEETECPFKDVDFQDVSRKIQVIGAPNDSKRRPND